MHCCMNTQATGVLRSVTAEIALWWLGSRMCPFMNLQGAPYTEALPQNLYLNGLVPVCNILRHAVLLCQSTLWEESRQPYQAFPAAVRDATGPSTRSYCTDDLVYVRNYDKGHFHNPVSFFSTDVALSKFCNFFIPESFFISSYRVALKQS